MKTVTWTKEQLKSDERASVVAIEAEMLRAARHYFDNFGFTEVVVPHLTRATGACENINTMFDVDYFGTRGYLAQTGQLYLEALIPHMEIERPCAFGELLQHIERVIHAIVPRVAQRRKREWRTLGVDIGRLRAIR